MKETVKLFYIVEQQKLEDKTTTTMTRKQKKKVKKKEMRESFVYTVGCQRGRLFSVKCGVVDFATS